MKPFYIRIFLFLACCTFNLSEQAIAAKSFQTEQWLTANGARVIFYQAMEVPMLEISVAFAAGSAYDGKYPGLSALTTRMLNQGNAGLNATVIAEKLADTGAQYSSEGNRDMIELSLKTLITPKALKESLDIFSLIINKPDFPEQAFSREKNQQLMAIAQAKESPDEIANLTFFKALYQNHPYAHPINGYEDSVKTLNVMNTRNFYRQFFVGKNAVIVLAGAIDTNTAHQIAEQLVGQLPVGQEAPQIPKAKPLSKEHNIEIQFPSSQTVLRLGQIGINHNDKNYFPLLVGNYTLGGGSLVSRLALEVREKRGLTYGVYSQFIPMPGLGPFIISLATQNKQTLNAVELTREILSSFRNSGPSEAELLAAKQYLAGSFPLALASNRSIADMLLKIAFYRLPNDYLDTYVSRVNAVTAAEIQQAFQELIKPEQLVQVTVGKM
ncbi:MULTISPECIES: M16 family metallopeptidase [Legionella]|uniref:Insulinase family protein n=1 Tax=Legionella septentrionalis TaxID=2498109 RepID=A0A433JLC5_9GAMM|nr:MULTISPECIES: pitrilysin family protein [Legionella]MCP0914589.1 insulinase family protein [Legionella sp. 27cVA30]RUQ90047.1 insulinase family protein [Legionella septentrionalis]RUQ96183.1 insulinase family protein [Legionella septentrionalis]RUR09339.1 insulinase family protein [Legionella septentrionalis]RUR14289.1 insulinase family protein [Legionella septentrionalis]